MVSNLPSTIRMKVFTTKKVRLACVAVMQTIISLTTVCLRATPAKAQAAPEPPSVAIVTAADEPITGLVGLPAGGSTQLKAAGYQLTGYNWYRNGNPLAITTQTLTVNLPGEYTVEGCGSQGCITSLRAVVVNTDAANGQVMSYSRQTGVAKPGITTAAGVQQLTIGDRQQLTSYFDGLSRPLQSYRAEAAPNRYDMVTFQQYDEAGGQPRQYLPLARFAASRPYEDPATLAAEQGMFYQGLPPIVAEAQPYASITSEASPLYRLQQATRVGQVAENHPKTVSYEINTSADEIRYWTGTPGQPTTLTSTQLYDPGALTKTVTVDEDGRTAISFQNELGQIVLQRRVDAKGTPSWLDTYTVYDDLGRVSYTISPQAVEELRNNQWTVPSNDFANLWLHQYRYDERSRLTSSQAPGAGAVETVYDAFDRPVLTQDGNRRAANSWFFTKFDVQGRTVVEGLYYSTESRDALQAQADSWSGAAWESRAAYPGGSYTTNESFPDIQPNTNGTHELLSLTFYDDYQLEGYASNDYTYLELPELDAQTQPKPDYNALGRPTVSRRRVLLADGSYGDWLTRVSFYDQYGNLIQQQSSILGEDPEQLLNISTVVYQQGGFVAQIARTIRQQYLAQFGDMAVTVRNRFEYDHAGRLLRVWQQNERVKEPDPEVLVASYRYNLLGQLIEKNLHSQDKGNSFLQSVDLRYNSNGELTSINNSELENNGRTNDDDNDIFGLTLNREEDQSLIPFNIEKPRFDGGITAVRWQVRNKLQQNQPQRERGYSFRYDNLGRLAGSAYAARSSARGRFDAEEDAYNEDNLSYDANGNLLTLSRNTRQSDDGRSQGAIDLLQYAYEGNRLRAVEDDSYNTRGFPDRMRASSPYDYEYAYDYNGNVVYDYNKELSYEFNALNKIARQSTATGEIRYDYDAAGTLLHRAVYRSQTQQTSDYYYVDGIEYERSARVQGLASVPTPEGRALLLTTRPPFVPAPTATTGSTPGSGGGGETPEVPGDTAPGQQSGGGDGPAEDPGEQIIVPRFVYEYHLRDHQNNLRVAFRAEASQPRQLHLTMEPNAWEEGKYPQFENLTSTRTTTTAFEGEASAAVTATNPGPVTVLPVANGDLVKVDLYYSAPSGVQYYRSASAPMPQPAKRGLQVLPLLLPTAAMPGQPSESGARPLARGWQLGLGFTGLLSARKATALPTAPAQTGQGPGPNPQAEQPAYIGWELRDDDGQLLDRGTAVVPVRGEGWQHFSTLIAVDAKNTARRTGHLRVQLLNDGRQPVYFDSVTIRQPQAGVFISQENHYYPFGMNLSGVAVNTLPSEMPSKEQYNGGSELEDDLLGAEAGNYSTPYRRYDATLGRFLGVDPLAGAYADQGPSVFAGDDPVNFQDPTGLWAESDGFGNITLSGGRGQSSFGYSYSNSHTDPTGSSIGMGVGAAPTVFDLDPKRTGLTNPWASNQAYSGVTSAQLMAAARQGGVYVGGLIYKLYKGYVAAGDDDEGDYKDSYLSSKPITGDYTGQAQTNADAPSLNHWWDAVGPGLFTSGLPIVHKDIAKIFTRSFKAPGATKFTSPASILLRKLLPQAAKTTGAWKLLPRATSLGGQVGRAVPGLGLVVTVADVLGTYWYPAAQSAIHDYNEAHPIDKPGQLIYHVR
jgi:RHS repeat-associated protein